MATKTCSKCGEEKDSGEFGQFAAAKDGHRSACRTCENLYAAARRKASPYKSRAAEAAWRKANPERKRQAASAWRKANPERKRQEASAWWIINREKEKQRMRAWRKANPEKVRAYNGRRRARKANAPRGNPTALAARLMEIYASPCARCGTTKNIHADHVIPLSKGGHHAAYNLQPLCGSCNSRKGNRLPLLLTA